MERRRLNIAVVGAGAAGLTAAHILQRSHAVALFEKNDYIGGHTHTFRIENGPDAGTPVDTGFIVLNDRTYPLLHKLLAQLGVSVRYSDMSFSYYCEASGLQYAGTGLNGIFAQRFNILKPQFLKMLSDITRFCRKAREDFRTGRLSGTTLGSYVKDRHFGKFFVQNYLLAMGAAIWSAPPAQILDFPAETFVRFFENHGLLSLKDRPKWQTVVGGSHSYVQAFLNGFSGTVRLKAAIRSIRREKNSIRIILEDGSQSFFDRLVLATHADEALALLEDPSEDEKRLLGTWSYQKNMAVLHTDSSVLPPNPRAWASWNYVRERETQGHEPVSVTYHMNRLQGLKTHKNYCVTLNRRKPIRENDIICRIIYTHPVYTLGSIAGQKNLPCLNGMQNTYYCGSYFGYGFHEDAVRSGVAVAEAFGLKL